MPATLLATPGNPSARTEVAARVVFFTFGSLGDLYPYLAIAKALAARGHEAVIATSAIHREAVAAHGLAFHAVPPSLDDFPDEAALFERLNDERRGSEFIVREVFMPHLRASFEATLHAAHGAALLVSHPLAYTVRLAAEIEALPWLSSALSPIVFFSTHDPPLLPAAPWLHRVRRLGRLPYAALFALLRGPLRRWARPLAELRAELGLPPLPGHPLLEWGFSAHGTLALFSRLVAEPKADWPPRTHVTGFPFIAGEHTAPETHARLEGFLAAGEPPLVFTLGSAAYRVAGAFYRHAIEAAQRLGRRALLVTGPGMETAMPAPLPPGVAVFDYLPYGEVFPRAAALVIQGGIGTIGRALHAGRPFVVVAFANDQPDNARRMARLGVARALSRRHVDGQSLEAALHRALADPAYAERALRASARVRAEDGAAAACDVIEQALADTRPVTATRKGGARRRGYTRHGPW